MHFYNFNIKDFNNDTRHLSHLERALYRDLMDLYYDTEKPISNDIEKLARRLLCRSDEEKETLLSVLKEFFQLKKLKGDSEACWHHDRIDYEIKSYRYAHKNRNASVTQSNANVTQNVTGVTEGVTQDVMYSNANVTQNVTGVTEGVTQDVMYSNANVTQNVTNSKRQKEFRNRKHNMITALAEKGINASYSTSMGELKQLCEQNNVTQDVTQDVTDSVTHRNERNGSFGVSITNNQEPITNNHNISPHTPQGDFVGEEQRQKLVRQKTQKAEEVPQGFEDFWNSYPNHSGRRKDKHKCLTVWKKQRLETIASSIVSHVTAMAKTKKWLDGYEPLTLSYLNGRQWEDGLPDVRDESDMWNLPTWQQSAERMKKLDLGERNEDGSYKL